MSAIKTFGVCPMVSFDIPYVLKYRRAYRYRRVVPPTVQAKIGRKNWIKTWRRGTPVALVEHEARQLAIKHDNEIAIAKGGKAEAEAREILGGNLVDVHYVLAMFEEHRELFGKLTPEQEAVVNALKHGGKHVPDAPVLSVALARDTELYGGERDHRPFKYAVESFIAVVGDKPVTEITRADATAWIASQEGLAGATVKRRLGTLRALVNRTYLDLEHTGPNPFARHQLRNGNGGASDRLPFSVAMLDLIDSYISTAPRLGPDTKNILKIMKGTGAGPAEISGLTVADTILDAKVPYVWIRENTLRGVKADARDRQIPLVGEALASAKDAMKRVKGKNPDKTPLFASFGTSGRGADSVSAKLNVAIRAAGIPKSKRLVAYSFRHTLKEALRSAGIPDHIQRRIMGHAGAGVADRYGSPRLRLAEARDALVAAMPHLGDVDDAIYSEAEKLK